MIDIKSILNQCSVPYVFIKGSSCDYTMGNDIDIFCQDKNEMARQIIHLSFNFVTEVSIKVKEHQGHIHIDFIDEDLVVRIDLIDTLNIYNNLILSGNEYADLAIRLMEYGLYPNKKKHFDYVYDKINSIQQG